VQASKYPKLLTDSVIQHSLPEPLEAQPEHSASSRASFIIPVQLRVLGVDESDEVFDRVASLDEQKGISAWLEGAAQNRTLTVQFFHVPS
jgi:hypothetical protein